LCPQLETVYLSACPFAELFAQGVADLLAFARRSPLVTSLQIDHVSGLSDANLIALLTLWPHLSYLDLQHTNLNGTFVESVPSLNLPLTHFGLSHCGTIKASPIIKLVKSSSEAGAKLQSLTLIDCPAMEPEGLQWLRDTVPQVKHRSRNPTWT
jgi:hypothetical protein